jgi:hypothetical protein
MADAVHVAIAEPVAASASDGLRPDPEAELADASDGAEPKSKRKGWWSLGR